ncbi:MAG: hypothetical protein ACMUEL_09355 [Flavobacteriales bacterium Tduv]
MILAVHSVPANEHDSKEVKPLIRKLGYKTREVYTDKSYQVPANVVYFHSQGFKTVYRKKSIGPTLSRLAILFKIISK